MFFILTLVNAAEIMEKIATPVSEVKTGEAFAELERSVYTVLETYSNVHRGSGHTSMVSTHLFDQARDIVLEYLGLKRGKYVVIFCTPRRETILKSLIKPGKYKSISSQEISLPLGVRAMVVDRKSLPEGSPFETGGGTTKLVAPGWVIWGDEPEKFEAGTPAIINIIAFTRALQLIKDSGDEVFRGSNGKRLNVTEILYNDGLKNYSGKELLDELRQTLIGKGLTVPTTEGSKPFINLDNAASTPTFMPVWNTFCRTWDQHKETFQEIINEVRSICAGLLVAQLAEYDLIFTSNNKTTFTPAVSIIEI